MAKMIPRVIDTSTVSSAEKKIFTALENDPLTKQWIVFHSFGIEKHPTLPYGEIDFLVLAPQLGIFALEIKGGRVRREQGMWIYTDKFNVEHSKSRGPFEQAKDGIYGLMQHVSSMQNQRTWNNYNFGFGVVFPDIVYDIAGMDADQKQVFDRRNKNAIGKYIIDLADYHYNKYDQLNMRKIRPNIEDIKDFAYVIRRDFDITVTMHRKIELEEERIIELTEQQQMCIDGLSDNPRCLIHGLAGTGKTLLAIKNAKESSFEGKRVALFCYNLLLGEYMKRHFQDYSIKPTHWFTHTVFRRYRLQTQRHIKK
jgi:hypothetical protein